MVSPLAILTEWRKNKMGIIANYQYLSNENLNEMKHLNGEEDEIFEEVEDWNEEAEILLDIDKMWDVLHFVLTGVDSSEPIEGNPLSEAVVGVTSLEEVSEFIAYIEKDRVADIISALENFDIDAALESFSMEACKKAELYPDIWDKDVDVEGIKKEIYVCFKEMIDFYKQILEANGNVLVKIY